MTGTRYVLSPPSRIATISCALVATFTAAAALAQNPVDTLPTNYLTREANARHWVPVQFAPSRAQSTWDSSVIAIGTRTITRVSLRPDMAQTAGAMVAHSIPLSMHMSSVGVPAPGHVSALSYSYNRGSDRTQVLANTNVSFPAFTPGGSGPAPWTVAIPIQPFAYQSGNSLQIEWDVGMPAGGSTSWNWFCDAERFDPDASYGYFVRDMPRNACPNSGTEFSGDVGGPGEQLHVWFSSLAGTSRPAVMFIGTSQTSFGGASLPLDLSPYGFPGCKLWTSIDAMVAGSTDASGVLGRFGVYLPIPFDPNLANLRLYCQDFVLDPGFGGGVRASDQGIIQIGNAVPRRKGKHLYTYSTAIDDLPEFKLDLVPIVGIN